MAQQRNQPESGPRAKNAISKPKSSSASTVEELREPWGQAFDLWIGTIALEGAIVLSRAEKVIASLERAAVFVVQTVRANLPKR